LKKNYTELCPELYRIKFERDLNTKMVTTEIRRFVKRHEEWLLQHDNVQAIQLLDNRVTTKA
jgi:hypothetical protein